MRWERPPLSAFYTFSSKGKNFELVYDRSEQDANQKLSIYLTLDGVRYRYTTPTPSTQENFANVDRALWDLGQRRRKGPYCLFSGTTGNPLSGQDR